MNELDRVFSQRGWLSRQPAKFRKLFIALGRMIALERGAPVYHMGDGSGGVFGVVSGGVAVRGGTPWQSPVLAHIVRAGDWFGHGPVLRGGTRSLTFIAAEPTRLLQVSLERLRPQLQGDPQFAARMAQMADASTETVVWAARRMDRLALPPHPAAGRGCAAGVRVVGRVTATTRSAAPAHHGAGTGSGIV